MIEMHLAKSNMLSMTIQWYCGSLSRDQRVLVREAEAAREHLILNIASNGSRRTSQKKTGSVRKSAKEPRIRMEENKLTSND